MRLPLLLLLTSLLVTAQPKPANLRVSTWVREDIFAGFLENDMARHAIGVKKLEAILAANPKAADAIAWQGGSELLYAVRAHDAGDAERFNAHFARAASHFTRAAALAKEIPAYEQGVLAITGGSWAVFADRVPLAHRTAAWQRVRENYSALRAAQQPTWAKLPVHFRGEIDAGLAQAAQRLGEAELAAKLTAELASALPGTPYAVFAKRWLDKPETMAKSKLTCSTCHDAGRLQAVLSAGN
jgi:hypothetical protein